MSEAQKHLEILDLFTDAQEHGRLVTTRIGSHDEAQRPARTIPKILADRVLVVAREVPHHLLEVQAKIVARL